MGGGSGRSVQSYGVPLTENCVVGIIAYFIYSEVSGYLE